MIIKTIKILICSLVFVASTCFAQVGSLQKWEWLMGDWKGEASGQTGAGIGTFSLKPDLDAKVLVRKSHAEYPGEAGRPGIIHDDLMIIYQEQDEFKAIYFDNENHIIRYRVTFPGNTIVLQSEKEDGSPMRFRLSYIPVDKFLVRVKFEISQDGATYMTYTEGKCRRIG
jgi:hypothetical protein